MAPRVSICIPAYGRPRELREAIESVLAQDFEDLEVIVGDDSGDLGDVVRAIGDPRIDYRYNERRLGMAANWTSVMDRGRGELIGLLMDDDRLMPGFVSRVVERFDSDPSAGIVFTDHLFDRPEGLAGRDCALAGGRYEDFLQHYLEHMPVAVSATLMRRDVWWSRLRPLPDLATSDVVMHARAAAEGVVFHYVDEPLMIYRQHGGQSSNEIAFRDDVVAAWETFEFDDPRCEEMRRGLLATALASRGAARVKAGRFDEGRADLDRARSLRAGPTPLRERAIAGLARHPALARALMGALSRDRAAQPSA